MHLAGDIEFCTRSSGLDESACEIKVGGDLRKRGEPNPHLAPAGPFHDDITVSTLRTTIIAQSRRHRDVPAAVKVMEKRI